MGNTIFSMTGYGRGEAEAAGCRMTVELRSVNNRYLDIQIKTPRSLIALEQRIRKAVQDRFSRGRIDVFIVRSGEEGKRSRFSLDAALAEQYVIALRDLKERFGLAGEVDLSLLAGLQDLVSREDLHEDIDAVWQRLSGALAAAMQELESMRATEGAALLKDMSERLDRIGQIAAAIRGQSGSVVENAYRRMAETVKRLSGEQPDPARLAQEIAILAERTDITEELTRLESHLSQFKGLMADHGGETVGRKLDFLLQEMVREANTIASKAMDAEIARHVVEIKSELEKIREQAQNIE